MSAHHNRLSPVESVLLKSLSLVGVVIFTGLMASRWNHLLAQAASAETEVAETVAPEPEPEEVIVASASSTPVTPVVMTETVEPEALAMVDEATLTKLGSELYEQIDSSWQTAPTFSESLVYQVEVNQEGAIAKYTPLNSLASDHLSETPLATLAQTENSSSAAPFLVVMAPTGVLEVSPWTGK
ncbi:hypothetical protein [Roseofilum capinflatum]|uniref:Uncharacterized protein n=1 Tax=Roseofilum capinflatum BLCC-M114 TaxID=3022440 RepID=A0ABT7B6F2_9CYAN|nr:hypothetical protein [Roseofilum capinflatum]MDJ1174397.1 hypothetical protein [Roseofilum capinflatum BLCC-M114]